MVNLNNSIKNGTEIKVGSLIKEN